MGLTIEIGVSKTHKYASRESGDTAEIVERPGGGLSVVVIDGQGSGRGARDLSQLLSGRAVSLIKDGARDGVVARALNDFLRVYRRGQVSATLDIASVDLSAEAMVLTRAGNTTAIVRHASGIERVPSTAPPLGRATFNRPDVWHYPLESPVDVIIVTDGVGAAGARNGHGVLDLLEFVGTSGDLRESAQSLARRILDEALVRDHGRPADDCTVVVVSVRHHDEPVLIREMSASLPLP